MVHGDKIADNFPMIKMGPNGVKLATGVNLTKINRVENPNYIFLDLVIDATAKPGKFTFPFLKDINLQYELKARRTEMDQLMHRALLQKILFTSLCRIDSPMVMHPTTGLLICVTLHLTEAIHC